LFNSIIKGHTQSVREPSTEGESFHESRISSKTNLKQIKKLSTIINCKVDKVCDELFLI